MLPASLDLVRTRMLRVPDRRQRRHAETNHCPSLSNSTFELTRTLDHSLKELTEILGEREYIEPRRAGHLRQFCRILAEEAAEMPVFRDEISADFIALLELWVPFIDVGHLLLPDQLLAKPGPLTPRERETMQTHTTLGAELLAKVAKKIPGSSARFSLGVGLVRAHHERYDGTGYPDQLVGMEIPLAARIAALADAYEAMRSARSYRAAMSHADAVREISEGAGRFDPHLLTAFTRCAPRLERAYGGSDRR